MKKVFLLVIVFATFSFANAQEISYGLKAGLNYSNFKFSNSGAPNYDSRLSFHVGAVAEFTFSDKFAIQPELLYSSIGGQLNDYGDVKVAADNLVYAMDYISIPVMAKYYVAEGLSLEAGPQIGILASAKIKYDGESDDVKDQFNTTDFGAALGAGYKLENGIFLNLRYVMGLSDIVKDSGDEWAKNTVFQFSVGYKFN